MYGLPFHFSPQKIGEYDMKIVHKVDKLPYEDGEEEGLYNITLKLIDGTVIQITETPDGILLNNCTNKSIALPFYVNGKTVFNGVVIEG